MPDEPHDPSATPPPPPGFAPSVTPVAGVSADVETVVGPLALSSGWLKFLGVMSIIGGVLTALSCYGIVFAWLPIWLGILQWQAGDRLAQGYGARDVNTMALGADRLRLAFKIQGITLIVVLVIYVVVFVVFIAGMLIAGFGAASGGMGGTP